MGRSAFSHRLGERDGYNSARLIQRPKAQLTVAAARSPITRTRAAGLSGLEM